MEVTEFQTLLTGIAALAAQNDNTLTAEQIRNYFEGSGLAGEQLLKVLQYLKGQGIAIKTDLPLSPSVRKQPDQLPEAHPQEVPKAVPLTPEETAFLAEYRQSLSSQKLSALSKEQLFRELHTGSPDAKASLAKLYMEMAAQLAVQMNCAEIPLSDLIQEANVSLLMALEAPDTESPDEDWLQNKIRSGLQKAIEQQTRQKFEDDCLVAKVENLEAALKELTDDEDGDQLQFSVNELAILLDMDAEEIQNILHLTGEDK